MAKNQRQRHPLQDDTRQSKQTVRDRTQVSKRQRDRIEENRDRREQRRERQRSRRQLVDSIRSPKEDVRAERMDSRIVPVEDTFLGRPVGAPTDLPVVIGEKWFFGANSTIGSGGAGTLAVFDTAWFTTERNGYPQLYNTASAQFRIPAGLSGIWEISCSITWSAASAAGSRTMILEYADGTNIAITVVDGENQTALLHTVNQFLEGDEIKITVGQDSGGNLDILGTSAGDQSFVSFLFLGK